MENGQTSLPVLLFALQVAVSLPVGVAVGEEGQESVVNGPHLVHNIHRLCRLQTKQEILNLEHFLNIPSKKSVNTQIKVRVF